MQTFSQYAATRLLREHPARAQTFGGIALKTGSIQTFAGIDLITGMPVFIYTMPEKPSAIAEVYSEHIPTVLEFGFEHDLGFVVTSSAPGYTPLKPILTKQRLEWLVRASSRALADAHSVGLIHGNLEPAHFFACGDHLLLEGWGLPWGKANPDYQAPETNISLATDVFAWARSITMFGKGKPRLMLEGEFGRLIGHCLNPRPSERPTAQELVLALEQVLPPRQPSHPDIVETALELSATEFLETETNTSNPIKRTKPLEIPTKPEVLVQLEPNKPSKPELPTDVPAILPVVSAAESPKDNAATTDNDVSSKDRDVLSPIDLTSPEAKLDAIEAELALKPIEPEVVAKPTEPEVKAITEPEVKTINEPEVKITEPELSEIPDQPKIMVQESVPLETTPESQPQILENQIINTLENQIINTLENQGINTLESQVINSPEIPELIPEPAQLSEPEHLAADEPDVQLPVRASSRITDDSDADAPRPAIRIGFDEEDQSWRSVVTPNKPSPKLGRWVMIAILIGALIVIGGILLSQPRSASNPNPQPIAVQGDPSSGSVVQFVIPGNTTIKGRLIIVSAPEESQLAVGALLATVPGPVAFPVAGEYKVRIEIPKYAASEVTVRVPQETQVTLELPR